MNQNGVVARVNAVVFLRRLTAWRAWKKFFAWVEKAFGWGMVAWLLFWLVVYLIAGFQFLVPLKTALPLEWLRLGAISSSSLFFAWLVLSTPRLPMVILGNRDVMRLGLGPAAPRQVLEYPMMLAISQQFFFGALLGGILWIGLRAVFLLEFPFAPVTMAFLFAARVPWQMTLYASGSRLWLVLLWLCSTTLDLLWGLGTAGAFLGSSALVVIVPILVFITGWMMFSQTYQATFPPTYLQHSLVLAQLRALGLLLMQRVVPPAGLRERLQSQLRTTARRKTWRIPAPPIRYGASAAIAWRNALTMSSWSIGQWVFLLFGLTAFFATSSSIVPNGFALPAQVLILSFLALPLVGSSLPSNTVPIRGSSLLLGRVGIGAGLVFLFGIVALIWLPSAFMLATRAIFCLVLLEGLQRWSKNPSLTQQLGLAAALLTFAPEALLGFLGLGQLEFGALITLIFLIYSVQSVQD